MTVKVVWVKNTSNYVCYENEDMDFRTCEIKIRMWIPKEEIQTNVPGMYPPEITLKVCDDSDAPKMEPTKVEPPVNDWLIPAPVKQSPIKVVDSVIDDDVPF
jgi:hypothetical protein